ncbi:hypothetical protein GALMADRAFT_158153 [Galerina marginata CBS 339.88]|uniref:Uncharacterized protein n=1 Tax=Galerina marginata (strain CBS 339.88) TaxID=685588 RepID=A0A067T160_GALM3|nr:hypothetical protein GALMADRAFT_158153 [Galerina marginata CBS 339.88]
MPNCPKNDTLTSATSPPMTPTSGKRTQKPRQSQVAKQLLKEQAEPEVGKVHNIRGDIPYANRHLLQAQDSDTGLLYLYGGEAPDKVAADLHVLDTTTMKCTNLSKSLRVRQPVSEWENQETDDRKRSLPILDQPGFTFLSINGLSFLLLFGGHKMATHIVGPKGRRDEESDELPVGPSSALFFIRVGVEKPYWWHEDDVGGQVQPRVNPLIVAIGKKVFVFGGTKKLAKSDKDKPEQIFSFSVLEMDDKARKWIWTHRDIPYGVTNLIFDDLTPVYDQSVILLTPGRECFASDYEFTHDNMWFFDTENYTFKPVAGVADAYLPKNVRWYYVHTFRPLPQENNATLAIPGSSSAHPYASGRKNRPSHTPRECVMVCGWVVNDDNTFTFPKLWKFTLWSREFQHYELPEDVICSSAMCRFVVVDEQMYLLGDKDDEGDRTV